ncbi:Acriflavin resistance protein [Thioalkalivibrio nitratireducens DSM 14787]|uniref:Acriflavin resistance protein n=1 Tax=Thioalkalivibrio nitratireducens (strain DSM 14787 / UNIQEM 213 / ALEN2) TaxID=1255043 RepID=L0DYA5_THIND|nr:efflux RND transporter permease subunit [Thioalkalivibrio nitratireducens]AGA34584.1 Acriflavin resistance protein [Thioalkalivibrio nitratireducens DSM 14787]
MSEHNTQQAGEGQEPEKDLGLAGRMAQSFIHSPLSPLLLLATLAIGVLGLIITPRQEDPQISVPMVDIFVSYPGVPSEQVASLVARPLERLMSEISGVDNVYSVSHRGQSMVTVQFDVGEEMESSIVKVHDKLMSNRDLMPPGVSEPMVKPKGVDDVPTVTLTLWSHDLDDALLRQIALDTLQYLNEVPNTSQSFVVSGREEKVRVEVQPERLAGHNVTMDQIAQALQAANSERTAGSVEIGATSTPIYTGAFLRDAEDIGRILVTVEEGRPVYVRDVAEVIYGPGEVDRFVRYYTGVAGHHADEAPEGAAAVTIAIAKKEGSNGVAVANGILERLEMLKGQVIPDNVEVSVTRNYGETANAKVNELMFKLFIATAAVTVLVFIFLGLRAALVVLIVIPVVLLFTVFSAWLMGYTIDRVSLFALIFAIGILVDDAIVVVENIYRRWLMKRGVDTETTVDAVAEVGNPTILATFTVIAALLPMGFVTGMMGPYMQPIPALGSVAMLFSLVAAFLFTPWLAWRLRPTMDYLQRAEEKEHKQNEMMGQFFSKAIPGLVHNRVYGWGFLIGIVVVFFLTVMLFFTKDVSVKMLPLDNKPEFNVVINFPEGTALPQTATLTHELAMVLRDLPEVTAVQAYVGTASPFNFNGLVRHYYLRQEPWQADVQVQLVDKGDRKRTSHQIAVEARELLAPMADAAGARIQVVEMPPGPPVLQSVVAEVYGPEPEIRRRVARDLERMFDNAPHLDDVDSFLQAQYDVWHFIVERDKALRRGVTVDAVNRTLESAIGGQIVGDVKARSLVEPHLIQIRLPMAVRSDLQRLLLLPVPTMAGGSVPLSELGEFVRQPQDEPIFHKNLRPVEYVTAETVGRLAAPIYGMLEVQEQLKEYRLPRGGELDPHWVGPPPNDGTVGFEWAGEWTVTYETFRDMGIAFAIALVLIYMLVVWEFGNFLLPAIVMAPIPLTLIGIIPGHWLLGAEFTATSMIGFIALAGIIVRNSILLVDFARHAVAEGQSVMDAMIHACQARTRPILITAFALLAGSSVILFDPIFQGMAISLMFGTIVATLLTLLVIPLGCISASRTLEENATGGGSGGGAACAVQPEPGGDPGHEGPRFPSSTKMTDPSGGPVMKFIGLAGLYLRSLAASFVEGVVQLMRALARWILRLVGGDDRPPSGGGGPTGPAAPPDGSGGPAGGAPSGVETGQAESGERDGSGDRAEAADDRSRTQPGSDRVRSASGGRAGGESAAEKTPSGTAAPGAGEKQQRGSASAEPKPASARTSKPASAAAKTKADPGEASAPADRGAPPRKAGSATGAPEAESDDDEGAKAASSGSAASSARRRRGIRLK